MKANESILDFPKETLNPSIWTKLDDGTYVLRDEVRATIQAIVDWAKSTFKMPNARVNITGSNTSNSYSSSSDIDIHFNSPNFKVEKADDFNKIFRKKFEELVAQKPELGEVNGVKTEVYMQPNPFQDMMSVGCYDFLNSIWLVGPELKDTSFDPYAEYFTKDMKNVDDVIEDVRSTILQVYELAIALVKSNDIDFKEKTAKKLKPLVSKAAKIFNALRAKRKHKSSPGSSEEALKNRDDKDWQIADSSFKLLDKFGYLGILKACAQSVDRFDEDLSDIQMAMKHVVSTISDKISMHALDDSEECEFAAKIQEMDAVNESAKSMLSLAAVVGFLAIPNILPAATLQKELSGKSLVGMTVNSPEVKKAINNATTSKGYNGLNATNIINVVARTIYAEARSEGTEGLDAVASVIWNRAGGKPENFVPVISKKSQFSSWGSYRGGWTDKDFVYKIPSFQIFKKTSQRKIWDYCVHLATLMYNGDFKSTIGNRNMIGNKKLDNKDAWNSWGKDCDLRIGNHVFGYEACHDGFAKKGKAKQTSSKPVVVVVKGGDTLQKIAKDNNTTIDSILKLNKSIKDPNKIKIGQKIQIA